MIDITQAWPVAVFAHNEARNIIACLDSLQAASAHPIACYVLANACTDRTEALVREYAVGHANVHLVSIELGDKANAWNVFVHEVAPREASHYFFIDGDVRATPGSLDAMALALAQQPQANGVSALPKSGRGVEAFQRDMLKDNGVAGNLYGLRGGFVERIRSKAIRMPIGTIGEDALMGAMLKWDLRGDTRWDNGKVVVARAAGFDSLSPWLGCRANGKSTSAGACATACGVTRTRCWGGPSSLRVLLHYHPKCGFCIRAILSYSSWSGAD